MVLLIVRANKDCFRKEIKAISSDLAKKIRFVFNVLISPMSCGVGDVSLVSDLKRKANVFADNITKCLSLKAVIQFVNILDDDEMVVILDGDIYKPFDIITWKNTLQQMQNGFNPVECYHYYHFTVPQKYFPRYNIYVYADLGYDQYFGEWEKSKRRCRFCSKEGEGLFGEKKSSHAISCYLGNNSLFCLEECKQCNNDFGTGIEKDLENYYMYYRVAEGRKSRKGKPLNRVEGLNFVQEGRKLEYFADEADINDVTLKSGDSIPDGGINMDLNLKPPVVLHNVYRVLVKYVLSCLPNEKLNSFKVTRDWVMGNKHPRRDMLPPVYRIETLPQVKSPSLNVYIRNDNKKDLPYCVGELRFMEMLYVFAVPYCQEHDVLNAYLHKPLAEFVKLRYPNIFFTIENFCKDEDRMIITHVTVGNGGERLQPVGNR